MKRKAVVLAVGAALMLGAGGRNASLVIPAHAGSVTYFQGKPAPDFELTDLQDNPLQLSDYRGKAVALNFWATWCVPCKEEIPSFIALQKQYGPQGLTVIGIAMEYQENAPDAVKRFVRDMGMTYPVVMGTPRVAHRYGVEALPMTFYIGRDGNIGTRVYGISDKGSIEEHIKAALQQGAQHTSAATAPAAEGKGGN